MSSPRQWLFDLRDRLTDHRPRLLSVPQTAKSAGGDNDEHEQPLDILASAAVQLRTSASSTTRRRPPPVEGMASDSKRRATKCSRGWRAIAASPSVLLASPLSRAPMIPRRARTTTKTTVEGAKPSLQAWFATGEGEEPGPLVRFFAVASSRWAGTP